MELFFTKVKKQKLSTPPCIEWETHNQKYPYILIIPPHIALQTIHWSKIDQKYSICALDSRKRHVPDQDVQFFYTLSHLSALQNCALYFSTNFQFIFTFKNEVLNLVIELCSAHKLFQKYFTRFFKIVTHSFVAIELLTFFNNAKFHFYCSIDLSLFWLHKWYSPGRRGLYIYFKHLLKLFYWYFLIFRVFL